MRPGSSDQPRDPDRNCPLCPRLVAYREEQRALEPDWHNAPVPTFGDTGARLLVVGLAPGRTGANRTGRPFTGDYAGVLLYAALSAAGFANGRFDARPDDGLVLTDAAVTNAVRCVPPQNKPTTAEIRACAPFLSATLAALPQVEVVLALGRIAHDAVLRTIGARLSAHPFKHGAVHSTACGLKVADSYHPSRYNVNTGVLTDAMFHAVLANVRTLVDGTEDGSAAIAAR
ncbi:uracil-DNA glycosylase [Acuticoccus sediminis]|uniref:Type-5 uracil-DNA glycosylase n=1 Tax=Acuticoccus sediminis TaxID=2184697 RepID=A0A8B2NGP1_9HYPH|nr:uracil-DNA glycosylase [Acuticoccus sediminis]RAH97005.1 uracil-DNA glycosylase [Acuticoccus sediminis]